MAARVVESPPSPKGTGPDMAARIKELFQRYAGKHGILDPDEQEKVIRKLAPAFTDTQVRAACAGIDKGSDGITRIEFLAWVRRGSDLAKEVTEGILRETGDAVSVGAREAFQMFDKRGDGILDSNRLKRLFKRLGGSFTQQDISRFCTEVDKGGDGKISHKEFMDWLNRGSEGTKLVSNAIVKVFGETRTAKIKAVFKMYDKDGDGSLDIDELKNSMRCLGNFTIDEISKVCADLDKSKDGEISEEEFVEWMKSRSRAKEMTKAKAMLSPSDGDGLEIGFYNCCGAGRAEMDGMRFVKVLKDCKLLGKELDEQAVDAILNDPTVKRTGQRFLDFDDFEVALELVADKRNMSGEAVRAAIIEGVRFVTRGTSGPIPFSGSVDKADAGTPVARAHKPRKRRPIAPCMAPSTWTIQMEPGATRSVGSLWVHANSALRRGLPEVAVCRFQKVEALKEKLTTDPEALLASTASPKRSSIGRARSCVDLDFRWPHGPINLPKGSRALEHWAKEFSARKGR